MRFRASGWPAIASSCGAATIVEPEVRTTTIVPFFGGVAVTRIASVRPSAGREVSTPCAVAPVGTGPGEAVRYVARNPSQSVARLRERFGYAGSVGVSGNQIERPWACFACTPFTGFGLSHAAFARTAEPIAVSRSRARAASLGFPEPAPTFSAKWYRSNSSPPASPPFSYRSVAPRAAITSFPKRGTDAFSSVTNSVNVSTSGGRAAEETRLRETEYGLTRM